MYCSSRPSFHMTEHIDSHRICGMCYNLCYLFPGFFTHFTSVSVRWKDMKVSFHMHQFQSQLSDLHSTDAPHHWRGYRYYHRHHRRVCREGDASLGILFSCSVSISAHRTRLTGLKGSLLCYIYALRLIHIRFLPWTLSRMEYICL